MESPLGRLKTYSSPIMFDTSLLIVGQKQSFC